MTALLHIVQFRRVINVLAGADFRWLLAVYGFALTRRGLEAHQLSLIFRYLGYAIGWFRVFRANSLAVFYGMFVPGAVASVAKWTDLTAVTKSSATVLNAIVYNRFLLDLQPIFIGAAVLLWKNPTGEPLLVAAACFMALFALILALCIYSPQLTLPLLGKIQTAFSRASVKIGIYLNGIVKKLCAIQTFPISRHLKLSLFGFAAFGLGICARVSIMKALGFHVPVTTIIWVDAVLIVAGHIPLTISNLGVREGLIVAVFGLYGISSEQAFAYGLLVYSCKLLFAILGGIHQFALVLEAGKKRTVTISQS